MRTHSEVVEVASKAYPQINFNSCEDLRTEAAQCIWEEVDGENSRKSVYPAFFDQGAVQARYYCREKVLTEACSVGIQIAQYFGYDLPYDWEFVPAFLQSCLTEDRTLKPDWMAICEQLGKDA